MTEDYIKRDKFSLVFSVLVSRFFFRKALENFEEVEGRRLDGKEQQKKVLETPVTY